MGQLLGLEKGTESPDAINAAIIQNHSSFDAAKREQVIKNLETAYSNARADADRHADRHAGHQNRINLYARLIPHITPRQIVIQEGRI